jgi:hypothetical protein
VLVARHIVLIVDASLLDAKEANLGYCAMLISSGVEHNKQYAHILLRGQGEARWTVTTPASLQRSETLWLSFLGLHGVYLHC